MKEEQIEKQMEWLENERRQDKQTISQMQKKIDNLETLLEKTNKAIQALDSEQTKFGVRITKMDGYDDALTAHRKEVKKELGEAEKRAKKREGYAKQKFEDQVNDLTKGIAKVEQGLTKIPALKDSIDVLKRDTIGRDRSIAKLGSCPA